MMISLSATIDVFNHALSLIPRTSTQVMPMTTRNAGRLNRSGTPSSTGAWAIACAPRSTAMPSVEGSTPPACAAATWRAASIAER